MKVGIDTFGLDHGQSGLGSYLYYLMSNLPYEEDMTYELFGEESDRYTYKAKFDTQYAPVEISEKLNVQRSWHIFKLNKFSRQRKYDVVLYSAATRMIPSKFSVKGIAIVNDVLSFLLAGTHHKYLKTIGLHGLKKADAIIVPSEYVKNDLISFGLAKDKIKVIPNGIDHSIFYPQNLSEGEYVDIKPFAIKRPYLIYPSKISHEAKKHIQLIKAFNVFKEKTKLPHRLVLAGSQDDYADEVQKYVLDSPYASDIFMTGFFPHKELGLLYSNADACIFPSSQEGVGLSILETMACGIPVACADSAALPEVSGGNAVLFNPDDINQMAQSIEKVVCDKELREHLVTGALEWTKKFTWANTASKLVEVIKSL
ncbi:MAG: glycosyltransferase family 4 protein [Treponema sp.]|uniref:glycosyltransferase family 4 protein n=1 Tax=Treponema sp. TaxID=166 RepID=UPI001B494287|nr:glycosyltransferase family 1 protein [Treponema sp.]MBP5588891.1 glycosyltransferase family 4 protein [Treponema sp.]MCR5385994.1 glycosyltransferase family 4 protein [Treponema sp.]